MRKILTVAMILCAFALSAFSADWSLGVQGGTAKNDTEFTTFYNGSQLSKLKFKDVEANYLALIGGVKFGGLYFKGQYYIYSDAMHGDVTDSDYNPDGSLFLQSVSSAKDSEFDKYLIEMGYKFSGDVFGLDIFLGYEFSKQKYHITDGVWVYGSSGSLDGLNSEYQNKWYLWYAGIAPTVKILKWDIEGHIKGYAGQVKGYGVWNLRADLDHFESDDTGVGFEAGVAVGYRVFDFFKVKAGYDYIYQKNKDGVLTMYYNNGTTADLDFKLKHKEQRLYVEAIISF